MNTCVFDLSLNMFQSKLPHAGTTIFSTMSALAHEHKAINLGQGFVDYPMEMDLCDLAHEAMKFNYNQYAPMPGIIELRENISSKVKNLYAVAIDPVSEITIVPGGTYGIYTALTTILSPCDEVIILEPAYDSYIPNVIVNQAKPILISMTHDFKIDWESVKNAITDHTRAIIINTPHNPTGMTATKDDWNQLWMLIQNRNIIVISDEVYEHITFGEVKHESILLHEGLASRCFAIYSFGKVFNNTGWKLGYVIAEKNLTAEFRKIHQYLAFCCNTPMQYAIAKYLTIPENYTSLATILQEKRDFFLSAMKNTKFTNPFTSQGSFFQLMSYENISEENDIDFAMRLTVEYGVTAIPLSPFYSSGCNRKLLRFCFAKKESTLNKAVERLSGL